VKDNKAAKPLFACLVFLLFGIGTLVRIWSAWCARFSTNSDYGIVALMAKHMAEGRDFPVFFYGQAYMGSFEPAISAILCRLFGCSEFAVCLGTALVGCLTLVVIYLWARDIGGRLAGLAAMTFAVIGTSTYYYYLVVPRGGYAATLTLGTFVIWQANRIACRIIGKRPVPAMWFVWLGLAAGIGWWSNQLIVAALATAAVTLLIVFNKRALNGKTLLAGASFIIGSLPWWIWNLYNNWRTLKFRGSLGAVSFREGTASFYQQFIQLSGLTHTRPILTLLACAGFTILALVFIAQLAGMRRRREYERLVHAASVVALFLFMFLVYSTSHFARFDTTRYLLPVYPAVAVMLGVAVAAIRRHPWGIVAWALLAAVVLPQIGQLAASRHHLGGDTLKWEKAFELETFAAAHDLDVLHADYATHWMNFATRERLCLTGPDHERYDPYKQIAVSARNPAFISGHLGVEDFLRETRGSATHTNVAGYRLCHNLRSPEEQWAYIPADQVASISLSSDSEDLRDVLTDMNLDTYWATDMLDTPRVLTWSLKAPALVKGMRLINANDFYPGRCRIDVRSGSDGSWQTVVPVSSYARFFWSGPKPFWDGLLFFREYRFEPVHTGTIRLVLEAPQRPFRYEISELLLMQAERPSERPSGVSADILELIEQLQPVRLYAPRWVSETLLLEREPLARECLPEAYFPDAARRLGDRAKNLPLDLDEGTVLLVAAQDAEHSRRCLEMRNVEFAETDCGGLYAFRITAEPAEEARGRLAALYWTECGVFLADSNRFSKHRATLCYQKAESLLESKGSPSGVIEQLDAALGHYPQYQPALKMKWNVLALLNDEAGAEMAGRTRTSQTTPSIQTPARFEPGMGLLGVNIPDTRARQGGMFKVSYLWMCAPDVNPHQYAVFVHFISEHTRFQGDHVFLEATLPDHVRYQPFPEVFTVEREVHVPPEAVPGDYRMVIGVYDRYTGERCRAKTELPKHREAVTLPVSLTVL
jgi:4-amino-4-deoxy-L-arabinose transferase-like glycosyltransferase